VVTFFLARPVDNTETRYNPAKAKKNAKHSKTKLLWFNRLLWHSARKRDGHILQRSQAHARQQTSETDNKINTINAM